MSLRNGNSRFSRLLMAAALVVWAPETAWGCPVCFAAEQRQLTAYFATAVLLSLLPFVLAGAITWWIRREARRSATNASDGPALC